MKAATKFTFDTEFRSGAEFPAPAPRARQKRSLTQEELDQLCALARAEGRSASEVCALDDLSSAVRDAADVVRESLRRASLQLEAIRAEATQLALVAAQTLARAALAAAPEHEVAAALRDAMRQAIGEPRIVLRVAPEVADVIVARLAEIANDEGYEGRIQISPETALRGADCRIEWRGGGAERAGDAIEAALADLIARRFSRTQESSEEDADVHQ